MVRLENAMADLPDRDRLPRLVLAAEVAWRPNMEQWTQLDQLCIEGTKILLLELPCESWDDAVLDSIYNLLNKGFTPLLAHLERYFPVQRKVVLEQIVSIGVPIQISAGALLPRFFSRKMIRLMQEYHNMVLGSDCHNLTGRLPNMGKAAARLEQRLGKEVAGEIIRRGDRLLES